jgi:hypothetical protein
MKESSPLSSESGCYPLTLCSRRVAKKADVADTKLFQKVAPGEQGLQTPLV